MDRQLLRRIIAPALRAHGPDEDFSDAEIDEFVKEMRPQVRRRLGNPTLPHPGETACITISSPKTAALVFDRVWSLPTLKEEIRAPKGIAVFGLTEVEIILSLLPMLLPRDAKLRSRVYRTFADTKLSRVRVLGGERAIAESLFETHRVSSTTLYNSKARFEQEYMAGKKDLLLYSLEGALAIDENTLDWRQVVEVRKDKDARNKLRRMTALLNHEMVGKPVGTVAELLATRLDDYEWSLKKHGILTVSGVLSGLLDPAFLGAAAAVTGLAYMSNGFWAGIAGLSLVLGKTAVTVVKTRLDLEDAKRGPRSEVAFIHHVRKKLATKTSKSLTDIRG